MRKLFLAFAFFLVAPQVHAEGIGERPGWVVIETEHKDGTVSLSVADSGPGIPEGDIEHIFDAFYTSKKQGMGLGLAICRTVVESLGGTLRAENRPEGGAELSITIPAATAGVE